MRWQPAAGNARPLPVRLFVPAQRPGALCPLILFFHGAGERGSDSVKHLEPGQWHTGRVPGLFAGQTVQAAHPCFVLAPQCPEESRWVEWEWERGSYDSTRVGTSACMTSVIELLDWFTARHPVDRTRLYACGLSMGGYGCWDILARRPAMFAAVLPICGGGDPRAAGRFAATQVWAFHGALDPSVPVAASRDMIQALRRNGASPRYTEIAGGDHSAWVPFCDEPGVVPWLFSQCRPA